MYDDIPGIGVYDGHSRPALCIIDDNTGRTDWHVYATDEIIRKVCDEYDLKYDALRTTIVNVPRDTHTVAIKLSTYKEFLQTLESE